MISESSCGDSDSGGSPSESGERSERFLDVYGRQLFWTKDAWLGYATAVACLPPALISTTVRANLETLRPAATSLAALGLTFVLASMSFLSGMLDSTIVRVLDAMEAEHGPSYGLPGLLMAFKATATIAAAATLGWLALALFQGQDLEGVGWILRSIAGSVSLGLTTWLVAAVLGLIRTIAVLLKGKASSLRRK